MSKTLQKIAVDQLQVGNYIRLPISWREHPFMFNSFKIRSRDQIQLLKKLRLTHVVVDLKRSDAGVLSAPAIPNLADSVPDLDKMKEQMLHQKQQGISELKEFRREYKKHEREYADSLAQLRAINNRLPMKPMEGLMLSSKLIKQMAASLSAGSQVTLHLMNDDIRPDDPSYHALNVTVLAMMLAKRVGMSEEEIAVVGQGGLLHDCGKLLLSKSLLSKKQPSKADLREIQRHPILGQELLRNQSHLPRAITAMISQHHEFLDGSGYPKGLKGNDIEPLAQLIAVVNTYDDLCHPRDKTRTRPPGTVLGMLYKIFKDKLNNHYVQQFIKMMGVYPPGSVVQLSSGQFGLVTSVDSEKLLYPTVLVYDPAIPRQEAAAIAIDTQGLTIERSIVASALTPEAFQYLSPKERISYFYDTRNG
ncbi:HD-GYP domain-containing protein [Ferrimonas sp.]|uniref:HD-GYP domain-containing protein n=1 Tax=Ferrimonas sp. TaxID=2080861 RepID=UPI003A90EBA5